MVLLAGCSSGMHASDPGPSCEGGKCDGPGDDPDAEGEADVETWFSALRNVAPGVMGDGVRQDAALVADQLALYPVAWTAPFTHGVTRHQGWCAGHCSARVVAIAVDTFDPDTVYIAEEYGGVARSIDGGQTWRFLTDAMPSLNVNTVIVDPLAPGIVYAGTGGRGAPLNAGVYRSDNSGDSWSVVGSLAGSVVKKLAVDPVTAGSTTATTLYAVVQQGQPSGLYRSIDSGDTWTVVHSVTGAGPYDLALDPAHPGTIYVTDDAGLEASADSGATWSTLHANAPQNQKQAKVAISGGALYYADAEASGSLFLSQDGGETWSLQSQSTGSAWSPAYLAASPADPATVVVGGGFTAFWVSHDSGKTLAGQVTCSGIGVVHPDAHALAFAPSDPTQIYIGNDGGVYRSNDGGGCWSDLNANLPTWMSYSVDVSDDGHMIASTQDNGNIGFLGNGDWLELEGGDGAYDAIDHANDTMYFGEYVTRAVGPDTLYREDGDGTHAAAVTPAAAFGETANFLPPFAHTDAQLMTGFENVYVSTSRGDAWTKIGALGSDPAFHVAAICSSPADPSVIYAGLTNGRFNLNDSWPSKVFVTRDAADGDAAMWTESTVGLPGGVQQPTSCAVDPTNAAVAYMTYTHYGGGELFHLYKTTDYGATWVAISGGLPDAPMFSVVVDPAVPSQLFVGTDVGAFTSPDGGATWSTMASGIPSNFPVTALAIDSTTRQLVAATYGRGIYTLTVPAASQRAD
jgi:photosystem II stability/assembly factor-like uncharacterized protein